MSHIEASNLTFKYLGRRRPALRDVSFRLARGELLLVLGPSGCGKSTLTLCLNGAIPHFVEGELSGRVRIGGLDTQRGSMADLAQRVGVVFQDPDSQFCMLTLEDEVAFGLENLAIPRAEMDARIDEALGWVGLAHRRRDSIENLSGGQKQRLALACVLAQRPEILIFDEPTAQVDPAGAAEVISLLERLRAEGRHTLVIVEHRLDDLMHLVDRTLVLSQDGEVVAEGPPRQVLQEWGTWLTHAGVWVPQVAELAISLSGRGIKLDRLPLTVDEAVETFRPLLSRLAASDDDSDPATVSGSSAEPAISVDRLTYVYSRAQRTALEDVHIDLWPGQFAAVVGANGAGKSTLARSIVRILRPPPGSVRLRGVDVMQMSLADITRRVGYVFQYPEHQFVGRSALEDVSFGLRRSGVPEAEARQRAQLMLEEFGLGHLGPAHPYSLSHGEQRRLSVAAMLVLGQPTLILDEPTFGQDRRNADLLVEKLTRLARDGRAIVAITHDMRLVAEVCERAVVMVDGRIELDAPPRPLFSDTQLLRRARLRPPPVTELSQRLALPRPFARVRDIVAACRPLEPVMLA